MDNYINGFMDYLSNEKRMAKNSQQAYKRDISEFAAMVQEKEIEDLLQINNTEVVAFLLKLKNEGKSSATVNRKLSSIRAFYNYMTEKGYSEKNPTLNIKSPKIDKKQVEYLTLDEVDRLLSLPEDTVKGKRDKAMLEVLYATGIRVTEMIEMDVEDVNLRMGFVACTGEHSKPRIIPLGRPAREALEVYIYEGRPKILKDKDENHEKALFLNYAGERLTRQGLWKVLKEYAKLAEIENKLNPQILRNSFAAHMIQNGADLKSLQELLGHEDITTTQVYLSVSKNHIKEVYDKAHPRA
jgi:integrase/recombinase XerD